MASGVAGFWSGTELSCLTVCLTGSSFLASNVKSQRLVWPGYWAKQRLPWANQITEMWLASQWKVHAFACERKRQVVIGVAYLRKMWSASEWKVKYEMKKWVIIGIACWRKTRSFYCGNFSGISKCSLAARDTEVIACAAKRNGCNVAGVKHHRDTLQLCEASNCYVFHFSYWSIPYFSSTVFCFWLEFLHSKFSFFPGFTENSPASLLFT